MLGQSWLNEAVGVEAEHLGPTLSGDKGSIGSVVQEFLRNDAGFSRADVVGYINVALQNEAKDLWQTRNESLEVIGIWRRHVERGTGGFVDVGAVDAGQRLDVMRAEDAAYYNRGRACFGEAVLMVRESGDIPLTPETCEWVSRLDHDKHLSDSMAVDVETTFGAGPVLMTSTNVSETTSPRQQVDFSREIDSPPGVPVGGRSGVQLRGPVNLSAVDREARGGNASGSVEQSAATHVRRPQRQCVPANDKEVLELAVPELEPA